MSSNKTIKDKMIRKYGEQCWIELLHLRPADEPPRKYTSKGQYKRMKQLTYHHINEKRNGGPATEENGAILSAENHIWFHKQPPEVQRKLNQIFQEYKRRFNYDNLTLGDLNIYSEVINYDKFITEARKRYNRAAKKREDRKILEKYHEGKDLEI